jgi:hypothetical protein
MSNTTMQAGAVFEPLLVLASARVVALVESDVIDREDAEFLLRALIELGSDGVELFGAARPADDAFYEDVTQYLVARAGPIAADVSVLARASAETIAAVEAAEGRRVAELVRFAGGRDLDRAVIDLIAHQGGSA